MGRSQLFEVQIVPELECLEVRAVGRILPVDARLAEEGRGRCLKSLTRCGTFWDNNLTVSE